MQDPGGNPTRSVLGMTDDAVPAKSPSEARPPGVNTGSDTSRQYQKKLFDLTQSNSSDVSPRSANWNQSTPDKPGRGRTEGSIYKLPFQPSPIALQRMDGG